MLIAIDSSINDTGWAVFDGNGKLYKYGVIKTKGIKNKKKALMGLSKLDAQNVKSRDVLFKLYDLECQVDVLLSQFVITHAVVEQAGDFSYSSRTNKYGKPIAIGALIKCNQAYSHISTKLIHWSINTTSVIASGWIGRQSKAVNMSRASNIAGVEIKIDHIADAIMLGKWFLAGI